MAVHLQAQRAAGSAVPSLLEFLHDILGDSPGERCVFDLSSRAHTWASDNTGLAGLIDARKDQQGIYFGTALFHDRSNRKAENVRSLRAVRFDIDAGPDKVAKHGLDSVYATQSEAGAALVQACRLAGVPPTYVVSSGAGLHVYFCLSEDIAPTRWRSLAEAFGRKFESAGLKIDRAVTTDPARVLRPIGTLHPSGSVVEILKYTGKKYSASELERLAGTAAAGGQVLEFTGGGTTARVAVRPLNAEVIGEAGEGVTDGTIAELRSALSHLATLGDGGGYDAWQRRGAQLASLKGTEWEDAARGLFIDYSAAAPGFEGKEVAIEKWNKCAGDRTSWRAIFKDAYAQGWEPPHSGGADSGAGDSTQPGAGTGDDVRPTDLALSQFWCTKVRGEFGYDHSKRAWMTHTGGAWRYCRREEHVESFKGMAVQIRREAATLLRRAADDPSAVAKAKRFLACADRAQSANGTRAALNLAQSSPGIALLFEQFDQDPDLFNCANGVVHLPTGELRPHDPALMLHRQSPVPFDPAAQCPQFLKFMLQISMSDAEWVDNMHRVIGYCMSGHVYEDRSLWWLGIGANGKSVLANLLRLAFGTYATSAPSSFLMQARRDGGAATPELAMLPGVRLLMANEVEAGSRLSAQTLKVTVSTEHIAARPLYGQMFSFKPTHKTIVRGNHRPIIADDDEGIWRRIDLVPFDLNLAPEQRDGNLEARLMREAPGILAWMVRGFARWRQDGLRRCSRVRDASLAYRKESDIMGQWVDDACDRCPTYEVPQRQAYGHYRQWCADQGLRCLSKRSFTRSLRERGISERRAPAGAREELYTGVRLKP